MHPVRQTAHLQRRALLGLAASGAATALLAARPAHAQAVEIQIGGTGAALGTLQLLADAYASTQPGLRFTVLPSMGSGGGIKALLAGAIQIAASSRPLNEAEVRAGAVVLEYGRTPFVFAVAAGHPASGISRQQLVDLYAGRTEQWPDGSRLRLVLRPLGDSDSELIKNLSPAMRDAKTAAERRPGMLFTTTDQDTASQIEKIPGALGPSTLALMLSEKRALKALALDGVVPSPDTLASGRYPLAKPMLLITGPKTPPQAQAFVAFMQSPAARALLRQTGHWVPHG